MQPPQHLLAVLRQVLLDACAERKMRPLVIDQRGEQPLVVLVGSKGGGERGDHRRVDQVRLGSCQAQPEQRPVLLQPDLERRVVHLRGWIESCRAPTQDSPAAIFCRSLMKSTSRWSLGPSLKAVKPARASVTMLSASQARWFSLLRFQASSLGLRSSSMVLVVQSGKVSSIFAHRPSTTSSSLARSTVPRFISSFACLRESPALLLPKTSLPYSSCTRSSTTNGLGTNLPSTFSAGAMSVSIPM